MEALTMEIRMIKILLLITLLLITGFTLTFLTSCEMAPTSTSTSTVTDIKSYWPKPEWKDMTVKAVADFGKDLKQSPQCIVLLLSSLASYESDYNPRSKYTEKFPDSKGKLQISAGLLQLSLDDAAIYGCSFVSLEDIYDPKKNIECAVRIMNKWLPQDGVIFSASAPWKGMSRYWGPMRTKGNTIVDSTMGYCK